MNQPLEVAIAAAREAGALLRQHFGVTPDVKEMHAHDIKIDLDTETQELITGRLLGAFPDHALYGEEGIAGNQASEWQWIVDPIDGTVNYFYGMPHAAVSIALQAQGPGSKVQSQKLKTQNSKFKTILGVIYDPFTDELWTATRGGKTKLNGRVVNCSNRSRVNDSLVAIGFSKSAENLRKSLPHVCRLARRAKKLRIMGSAALELAYVASGRLDVYIERTINLWDIAAGGLMVECSGGEMHLIPLRDGRLRMVADNGRLRRKLGLNSLLR